MARSSNHSRTTFKVEGLRELQDALGNLPKATGKNVMRRAMKDAMEPMADVARARAPHVTGYLERGIGVSGKLSRTQRASAKEDKSYVEMYMGPRAGVVAQANEFGTSKMAPHPYMRPAWDQDQQGLLERMKQATWKQIEAATARLSRKAARAAKKAAGG